MSYYSDVEGEEAVGDRLQTAVGQIGPGPSQLDLLRARAAVSRTTSSRSGAAATNDQSLPHHLETQQRSQRGGAAAEVQKGRPQTAKKHYVDVPESDNNDNDANEHEDGRCAHPNAADTTHYGHEEEGGANSSSSISPKREFSIPSILHRQLLDTREGSIEPAYASGRNTMTYASSINGEEEEEEEEEEDAIEDDADDDESPNAQRQNNNNHHRMFSSTSGENAPATIDDHNDSAKKNRKPTTRTTSPYEAILGSAGRLAKMGSTADADDAQAKQDNDDDDHEEHDAIDHNADDCEDQNTENSSLHLAPSRGRLVIDENNNNGSSLPFNPNNGTSSSSSSPSANLRLQQQRQQQAAAAVAEVRQRTMTRKQALEDRIARLRDQRRGITGGGGVGPKLISSGGGGASALVSPRQQQPHSSASLPNRGTISSSSTAAVTPRTATTNPRTYSAATAAVGGKRTASSTSVASSAAVDTADSETAAERDENNNALLASTIPSTNNEGDEGEEEEDKEINRTKHDRLFLSDCSAAPVRRLNTSQPVSPRTLAECSGAGKKEKVKESGDGRGGSAFKVTLPYASAVVDNGAVDEERAAAHQHRHDEFVQYDPAADHEEEGDDHEGDEEQYDNGRFYSRQNGRNYAPATNSSISPRPHQQQQPFQPFKFNNPDHPLQRPTRCFYHHTDPASPYRQRYPYPHPSSNRQRSVSAGGDGGGSYADGESYTNLNSNNNMMMMNRSASPSTLTSPRGGGGGVSSSSSIAPTNYFGGVEGHDGYGSYLTPRTLGHYHQQHQSQLQAPSERSASNVSAAQHGGGPNNTSNQTSAAMTTMINLTGAAAVMPLQPATGASLLYQRGQPYANFIAAGGNYINGGMAALLHATNGCSSSYSASPMMANRSNQQQQRQSVNQQNDISVDLSPTSADGDIEGSAIKNNGDNTTKENAEVETGVKEMGRERAAPLPPRFNAVKSTNTITTSNGPSASASHINSSTTPMSESQKAQQLAAQKAKIAKSYFKSVEDSKTLALAKRLKSVEKEELKFREVNLIAEESQVFSEILMELFESSRIALEKVLNERDSKNKDCDELARQLAAVTKERDEFRGRVAMLEAEARREKARSEAAAERLVAEKEDVLAKLKCAQEALQTEKTLKETLSSESKRREDALREEVKQLTDHSESLSKSLALKEEAVASELLTVRQRHTAMVAEQTAASDEAVRAMTAAYEAKIEEERAQHASAFAASQEAFEKEMARVHEQTKSMVAALSGGGGGNVSAFMGTAAQPLFSAATINRRTSSTDQASNPPSSATAAAVTAQPVSERNDKDENKNSKTPIVLSDNEEYDAVLVSPAKQECANEETGGTTNTHTAKAIDALEYGHAESFVLASSSGSAPPPPPPPPPRDSDAEFSEIDEAAGGDNYNVAANNNAKSNALVVDGVAESFASSSASLTAALPPPPPPAEVTTVDATAKTVLSSAEQNANGTSNNNINTAPNSSNSILETINAALQARIEKQDKDLYRIKTQRRWLVELVAQLSDTENYLRDAFKGWQEAACKPVLVTEKQRAAIAEANSKSASVLEATRRQADTDQQRLRDRADIADEQIALLEKRLAEENVKHMMADEDRQSQVESLQSQVESLQSQVDNLAEDMRKAKEVLAAQQIARANLEAQLAASSTLQDAMAGQLADLVDENRDLLEAIATSGAEADDVDKDGNLSGGVGGRHDQPKVTPFSNSGSRRPSGNPQSLTVIPEKFGTGHKATSARGGSSAAPSSAAPSGHSTPRSTNNNGGGAANAKRNAAHSNAKDYNSNEEEGRGGGGGGGGGTDASAVAAQLDDLIAEQDAKIQALKLMIAKERRHCCKLSESLSSHQSILRESSDAYAELLQHAELWFQQLYYLKKYCEEVKGIIVPIELVSRPEEVIAMEVERMRREAAHAAERRLAAHLLQCPAMEDPHNASTATNTKNLTDLSAKEKQEGSSSSKKKKKTLCTDPAAAEEDSAVVAPPKPLVSDRTLAILQAEAADKRSKQTNNSNGNNGKQPTTGLLLADGMDARDFLLYSSPPAVAALKKKSGNAADGEHQGEDEEDASPPHQPPPMSVNLSNDSSTTPHHASTEKHLISTPATRGVVVGTTANANTTAGADDGSVMANNRSNNNDDAAAVNPDRYAQRFVFEEVQKPLLTITPSHNTNTMAAMASSAVGPDAARFSVIGSNNSSIASPFRGDDDFDPILPNTPRQTRGGHAATTIHQNNNVPPANSRPTINLDDDDDDLDLLPLPTATRPHQQQQQPNTSQGASSSAPPHNSNREEVTPLAPSVVSISAAVGGGGDNAAAGPSVPIGDLIEPSRDNTPLAQAAAQQAGKHHLLATASQQNQSEPSPFVFEDVTNYTLTLPSDRHPSSPLSVSTAQEKEGKEEAATPNDNKTAQRATTVSVEALDLSAEPAANLDAAASPEIIPTTSAAAVVDKDHSHNNHNELMPSPSPLSPKSSCSDLSPDFDEVENNNASSDDEDAIDDMFLGGDGPNDDGTIKPFRPTQPPSAEAAATDATVVSVANADKAAAELNDGREKIGNVVSEESSAPAPRIVPAAAAAVPTAATIAAMEKRAALEEVDKKRAPVPPPPSSAATTAAGNKPSAAAEKDGEAAADPPLTSSFAARIAALQAAAASGPPKPPPPTSSSFVTRPRADTVQPLSSSFADDANKKSKDENDVTTRARGGSVAAMLAMFEKK